MTRTVSLGGHVFSLTGATPTLGDRVAVPGAGVRALYIAPSLERWPVAAAQDFAGSARRISNPPGLFVCSADYEPIAEAWAARAGWDAVRFDKAAIVTLGLWIATLSLPARAVLILDATDILRFCQISARLEDEVTFDAAISPLQAVA